MQKSNYFQKLLLLFFLPAFIISGCARVPWTTALDEDQSENVINQLQGINNRAALCSNAIDGDILLSYQNAFEQKNIGGYFQFQPPSYIKFIVSNPFGQPVFMMTSDQHYFQMINTFERKFITGRFFSYSLRNKIPLAFIKGNWQQWLRGTVSISSDQIVEIRQDRDDRGVWVTTESEEENQQKRNHLLIDVEQQMLIARTIENDTGDLVAQIHYDEWELVGNCMQPHSIKITGLEYGTEMTLRLSDIQVADDQPKKNFRLSSPKGYFTQMMP